MSPSSEFPTSPTSSRNPDTRRAVADTYQHEMDESQHSALLDAIKQCKGSVMLSGYANELYDKALGGWNRHDRKIDNKVAGGKTKRKMTESLWCNF